ncbi:TPA: hypothetical protein HA265_02960 [Candidatus Woesearchaeota archaeon]|nr:hypothetical protein [Candidatus Woesearchaeota archaeon]
MGDIGDKDDVWYEYIQPTAEGKYEAICFLNRRSGQLKFRGQMGVDVIRQLIEPWGTVIETRSPGHLKRLIHDLPPTNGNVRILMTASGDGGFKQLTTALDDLVVDGNGKDHLMNRNILYIVDTGTIGFINQLVLSESKRLADKRPWFHTYESGLKEVGDAIMAREPLQVMWMPQMMVSSTYRDDQGREVEGHQRTCVLADGAITTFIDRYEQARAGLRYVPGQLVAAGMLVKGVACKGLEALTFGRFRDTYTPDFLKMREGAITVNGVRHEGEYNVMLITSIPMRMDLPGFRMDPCARLPPLKKPYFSLMVYWGRITMDDFIKNRGALQRGEKIEIPGLVSEVTNGAVILNYAEPRSRFVADGELDVHGSIVTIEPGFGVNMVMRTYTNGTRGIDDRVA